MHFIYDEMLAVSVLEYWIVCIKYVSEIFVLTSSSRFSYIRVD